MYWKSQISISGMSGYVIYRIWPNYLTVHLGFPKALGKHVVKYPPNKGTL